jgi:hypothetical protein
MEAKLQAAYEAAVLKFGREAADRAAEESAATYNTNALAGFSPDECAAEQLAAFEAALEQ